MNVPSPRRFELKFTFDVVEFGCAKPSVFKRVHGRPRRQRLRVAAWRHEADIGAACRADITHETLIYSNFLRCFFCIF
jgi:hypothetical protein